MHHILHVGAASEVTFSINSIMFSLCKLSLVSFCKSLMISPTKGVLSLTKCKACSEIVVAVAAISKTLN